MLYLSRKNHPNGSRLFITSYHGQKEAPQHFPRAKYEEPSTENSVLTENILRSEREIKTFSDEWNFFLPRNLPQKNGKGDSLNKTKW